MLKEEFETWPADSILHATLFALSMHVLNLGYIKNGASHVPEPPDGNTQELYLGLGFDYATTIPDNDDQFLPDLKDPEIEQAKKKAIKA